MPKLFSGKEIIKILCKKYGFEQINVVGSHVKLRKRSTDTAVTTVVPLHHQVFIGTFKQIMRQARIDPIDFIEKSGE
ncbi:MAG: type II toxin-antitoxin system HicA family toxin [Candidatus Taylorbacteria bacterium]